MEYPTGLVRHGFSSRVIEPIGSGSNKIMLVGEAPGEQEDRVGRPFYEWAPAGATLEKLLKRGGWNRDNFRITNAVWQRPPRNWLEGAPYEAEAIEAWRPFLEREIEATRPAVIVALGNIALKALTPYGGAGASITNVASYVLRGHYDPWVIATYHPSYIMQGQQKLSGTFIYAISKAMEIAKHGFVRETPEYKRDPSLDEMLQFEREYNPERHFLSYDIETPHSSRLDEEDIEENDASYNIVRASLCYETNKAISFPWQPPYVDVARRMLASLGPKQVWNGLFDNPRLRANESSINGRIHDVMEMWSFLQRSLPRGLAFVTPFYGWTQEPWKHLSDSDPAFYSACDADALHRNGEGIERDLRSQGRWQRYEEHVVECYEVLTKMSANGLPYDHERLKEFEAELQGKWDERDAELQRRVPEELKPSKQKHGLKREPKDMTSYVQRVFKLLANDLTDDEREANGISLEAGQFEIIEIKRWCLLEPFLPTSPAQVNALIKAFGHKVGINRKTKKETTDSDTIKKLIQKCSASKKAKDKELGELLKLVQECRQLSKVLGTYVKGWRPGKDGRIHSTPGYWGDMYRISWRGPNIAATVADKKEEQIAAGFRTCVATAPGRMLVEADWKGIEAVLVGWFAEDAEYMRLARLGVHDYMTAHLLVDRKKLPASDLPSLSWSDVDLGSYFKKLKEQYPKDRDDAKHAVHGTNYGMTWKLLAELYELTPANAKKLIDLYFSLFPKVKKWQERTLQQAHSECKLKNPWGYEMWFWDVLKWDPKTEKYSLGKDAKSAISFLPRDTAAGMLKQALLRLEREYQLASRGVMIASAHDAILCDVPEEQVDEVAVLLTGVMEAPVPELGGLSIGVEVAVGRNWSKADMKGWHPVVMPPQRVELAPGVAGGVELGA